MTGGGKDRLLGQGGSDHFEFSRGNDRVHGGSGTDTMVFDGAARHYQMTLGQRMVVSRRGTDETDILYSIERLQFDDQVWIYSGGSWAELA